MSNRKFRVWDNTFITNTYEKAIQIKDKIDTIIEDTKGQGLPLCAVPPEVLHALVTCYVSMYDKLLEENLLVAGYPKQSNNNLH